MDPIDSDSGSAPALPSQSVMSQFINSKVKEQVKERMNEFFRKYDLLPKGSQKAKTKQKRKNHRHHKSNERTTNTKTNTNKSHGHNLRPNKKPKFARHSRSVSIIDLFAPSTSKHTGKMRQKFTVHFTQFSTLILQINRTTIYSNLI